MSLDELLGVKYRHEASENFDKYTKAIGVDGVLRKVASTLHPVVSLKKINEEYILSTSVSFKNIEIRFRPGVEFDQETPDGRDVKSVITVSGRVLHEVQTDEHGDVSTIERTFDEDELITVLKVKDIVCTRRYRRENKPYY